MVVALGETMARGGGLVSMLKLKGSSKGSFSLHDCSLQGVWFVGKRYPPFSSER